MLYFQGSNGKLYEMVSLTKELERQGQIWVRMARMILREQDKHGGPLERGLEIEVDQEGRDTWYVDVTPSVPYWEFVDQGVGGANKSESRAKNSPFQFTGRYQSVPPKAIDRWAVRKGIQGVRDEKGRFIGRKGLVWAIARAIYRRGIAPSYFLSRPGRKIEESTRLVTALSVAYAEDLTPYLEDLATEGQDGSDD